VSTIILDSENAATRLQFIRHERLVVRMSRSPFNDGTAVQVISIEPASFENAPYVAALVASSFARERNCFGGAKIPRPEIAIKD
jgi:hypothetical protein